MGGTASVQNLPGGGAQFTVRLPLPGMKRASDRLRDRADLDALEAAQGGGEEGA